MARGALKIKGNIIGKETTYIGHERRFLTGEPVRIVAVFKGALNPRRKKVGRFQTDAQIKASGGIDHLDRVQVSPTSTGNKFMLIDVVAQDLECFVELRKNTNIRWI